MSAPGAGAPSPRPLFSADIFSDHQPRFSPVAPDARAGVEAILGRDFRHLTITPKRVLQAGGLEINSNNFKVETQGKTYLLKRLGAEPEQLRIQLRILQRLGERGQAVPRLERTVADDVLAADGPQAWCLFEFVAGDFFSGSTAQLQDVAERIGGMQKELRALVPALHPARKWAYTTALESDLLAEATARREEWPSIFGNAYSGLLAASWPSVAAAAVLLDSRRADLGSVPWEPAHCDLHPHNLLMRRDKLAAIVDFESFVQLPRGVALGYAAYKLLRQHAVHQRGGRWTPSAAAAARRFLDALAESDPVSAGDRSRLELFALAELFRRLLIVFKLALWDGNMRWNHVLPMHLSGLDEIGVIFR